MKCHVLIGWWRWWEFHPVLQNDCKKGDGGNTGNFSGFHDTFGLREAEKVLVQTKSLTFAERVTF